MVAGSWVFEHGGRRWRLKVADDGSEGVRKMIFGFWIKHELQHYELDVPNYPWLKKARTIAELCRGLQETMKNKVYPLLNRLIRLILTLPTSTATSERAFSAMKIVKTRLRCSMGDAFLKSCLLLYIERDIADIFTTDEIINAFASQKCQRVQLIPHKVTL
ncbi:uncharacterized protein [Rutidosis leptorrhynchoides]|uniref:uncharacterized protein n=1 Tax=Rutidosis leptorrhynchoides TaxID=125765 RepID=UPI003A9A1AF7